MLAFARARTRDAARAEDVAAQTFAQAFQAFGRYEERGAPVAAWLLRIAANVIAGQARRGGGVSVLPLTAQHLDIFDGAGEAGPDDWAERRERAAWLHGYLAELPPEQRRLLWLRFWEDRAIGDVAARIGRGEGATKQLLHRTVKTLRARMDADDIEPQQAPWGVPHDCDGQPATKVAWHSTATKVAPPGARARPRRTTAGKDWLWPTRQCP